MLFLRSTVSFISLNSNIGQFLNICNRKVIILFVVCLQRTPYILLGQCVLMLHHLQVLKRCPHILPELLLRYIAFIGVDSKAHQIEIPMAALDAADLPQPPMVKGIRIIAVYLSGYIPLLFSLIALYHHTLIPFRVCLLRLRPRHSGRMKRLIYIHPVLRLDCVSVQIIQRHTLPCAEGHQLRTVLGVDAPYHAETLIDGLILNRL